MKSGNSAVICVIESFCNEYCCFLGLVSKLGYFYLNLSWLTKQNNSFCSWQCLILYNLYEFKLKNGSCKFKSEFTHVFMEVKAVFFCRRFNNSFLYLIGKLFTNINVDTFAMASDLLLKEFRVLVSRTPLPIDAKRLVQVQL